MYTLPKNTVLTGIQAEHAGAIYLHILLWAGGKVECVTTNAQAFTMQLQATVHFKNITES